MDYEEPVNVKYIHGKDEKEKIPTSQEQPKERFDILQGDMVNCGTTCDLVNLKNGVKMCIHKKGEYVSDAIRRDKIAYCELSTMNHLLDILRKQPDLKDLKNRMTALDIGANIGSCSLFWANEGFKIYAFEPVHRNLECFRRSIVLNRYERQIKVYPFGLGENETYVNIDIEEGNYGNNVIGKKKDLPGILYGDNKFGYSEIVHVVPLDGVNVKERVHIAKIDTQGHELSVMKGSTKFFEQFSIDIILSEFAPQFMRSKEDQPLDYLVALHKNNYRIWDIKSFPGTKADRQLNDLDKDLKTNIRKFVKFVNGMGTGFTDLVCIRKGINL